MSSLAVPVFFLLLLGPDGNATAGEGVWGVAPPPP